MQLIGCAGYDTMLTQKSAVPTPDSVCADARGDVVRQAYCGAWNDQKGHFCMRKLYTYLCERARKLRKRYVFTGRLSGQFIKKYDT